MTGEIVDRRAAYFPQHALLVGGGMGSVTHQPRLLVFIVVLILVVVFVVILVFVFFVVVLFLLRDILGVFVGVHQILEIVDVGELDAHHPAVAVGIIVNGLGIVRQDFVCLHHLAAH